MSAAGGRLLLERGRRQFFDDNALEPPGVRDVIRRSWARVRDLAVPLEDPQTRLLEVESDTLLERAARPVLQSITEPLSDVELICSLAGPDALLRLPFAGRSMFARMLAEAGSLIKGYDFSESIVGTNGIGTALAIGRPVVVDGGEHYVEAARGISCAASPIRDPVSGVVVGAVNFTCPVGASSPLLLAMTTSAAAQIERELLTTANRADLAVLRGQVNPAAQRALAVAEDRRRALREHLHRASMNATSTDVQTLLGQVMQIAARLFPFDAVWAMRRVGDAPLRVVAIDGDVAPGALGALVPEETAMMLDRAACGEPGRSGSWHGAGHPSGRSPESTSAGVRPLPGQRRLIRRWVVAAAPAGPRSPFPQTSQTMLVVASDLAGSEGLGQRGLSRDLLTEIAFACDTACRFEEISKLAASDPLTGLPNRRCFLEFAQEAFGRCRSTGQPLATFMVDIDRFKRVNDTFGHRVGDLVLTRVARCIQAALRPGDIVGRIGGEEIAVVTAAMPAQALVLAEQLRRAVADIRLSTGSGTLAVTASVGVACLDARDQRLSDLLDRADRALYAAKDAGRDRVVAA
ncbi:diguanylate cyclase [Frankia sp. R82]|uniref:diguanylate cyclase n=1 Tax=Frankia sp. R82 TaxID=2950553 RepID=UPI002044855A|nr:diguanylate cyclase [Frankia sp. R82]MCM3884750.1 diguanylate cyclase [Frankia sp. R82]